MRSYRFWTILCSFPCPFPWPFFLEPNSPLNYRQRACGCRIHISLIRCWNYCKLSDNLATHPITLQIIPLLFPIYTRFPVAASNSHSVPLKLIVMPRWWSHLWIQYSCFLTNYIVSKFKVGSVSKLVIKDAIIKKINTLACLWPILHTGPSLNLLAI